ncbi:hypothetical protein F4805DRAFT_119638 [Annulohypoxylon moriforme]|nr:hypothetical protein F4805DRAFT_119638 [Annulohypoxylon moriforme]
MLCSSTNVLLAGASRYTRYVDKGSNDPSDGILTFNYVASPYCIGNCISAIGGSSSSSAADVPTTVTETVLASSSALGDNTTRPASTSDTTMTVTVDIITVTTSDPIQTGHSTLESTRTASIESNSTPGVGSSGMNLRIKPISSFITSVVCYL